MNRLIALGMLLGLLLSACGAAPAANPGYTTITPETITSANIIPEPTGPVVLSLTGKIGVTNAPDRLDFDMATLENLGLVEYTVDDPYLKRSVTYQGVLLQRLLDVAHVAPEATVLQATALNDFKSEVPIDVTQWPVMLATKRDGERMPITDKGPLEIVFPYHHVAIDQQKYNPMWVWQLRSMEIR